MLHQLEAPERQHHAPRPPGGGKQRALGQHVADDGGAACPYRHADRNLARPAEIPRQREVGQVETGHHENQKGDAGSIWVSWARSAARRASA